MGLGFYFLYFFFSDGFGDSLGTDSIEFFFFRFPNLVTGFIYLFLHLENMGNQKRDEKECGLKKRKS